MIPNVRHDEDLGELRALADEILFTTADTDIVRRDYTPAYTQESDEHVDALRYDDVTGVVREDARVRLETSLGDETFAFERDADAESFAALVSARVGL
jgi:hypothetical protein